MTVYEQWEQLIKDLNEETTAAFQEEYYGKEQAAYQAILLDPDAVIEGTFDELATRFSFSYAMFAGFMEGINTSLKEAADPGALRTDTHIVLCVDFDKLYFNMLQAKADWLNKLSEWDGVLSEQKRREITKEFQLSKQAKSQKIDRNAPCPCGSGKKYKKCCGVGV